MRVRRGGIAIGAVVLATCAGFTAAGAATPTTPTPTTVTPTTSPPTTATPTTTTTSVAPPVDRLVGVAWIQQTFASPCSDGNVQMVAGSAVDGPSLAVLDDVLPLHAPSGLAVAFLSCRAADGSITESTAVLVRVDSSGVVASAAEQALGPGARIVSATLPWFTVEGPVGAPVGNACCAPLIRRRTFEASAQGFEMRLDAQVATFLQTVGPPAVGGDGDLVRASVPAAALCYRWDNVYLSAAEPDAEPVPVSAPSAELQTVRLALIHVTGRWIAPSTVMTEEMADVVRGYQAWRGLVVDGQVGAETTRSLSRDLGCSVAGEFRQIVPIGIGPRRYGSIAQLVVVLERFEQVGSSGSASLDALLRDAGWDPANSLFLGCYRWENPPTGMSCSWSGRTPLQLVGLVDDAAAPGISSFSILYARSAAVV